MTVKIIHKKLGINKKLGPIKFENAFEDTSIKSAEGVLVNSRAAFKTAANTDFKELAALFSSVTPENFNTEQLKQILAYTFSIKARAGTANMVLASKVANSMYKFCEATLNAGIQNNFDVLKLHFNALNEIFNGTFPINEADKAEKLATGLEALVKKRLGDEALDEAL